MDQQGGSLSWGIEKRLQFVELRLFWEGRLNRGDLVDHFSISVPQASTDLARYQELAPGNLVYDKTLKSFVKGPDFRPRLIEPSADQYLNQLRLMFAGALSKQESWVGSPPPFCGTPRVQRHLSVTLIEKLLDAIRERRAVRLKYLSFSNPEPSTRWIAPHALGFDGQRWHARAWCLKSQEFRDFVIARMSDVSGSQAVDYDPDLDLEWHRKVVLRLVVNPRIQGAMREAVQRDFGMRNGVLALTTSICAAYYLRIQLNLDLDPAVIQPQRLQVVLENAEEVEGERQKAKRDAAELIARRYGADTSPEAVQSTK